MRNYLWLIGALACVCMTAAAQADSGDLNLNAISQAATAGDLSGLDGMETSIARFMQQNPQARFYQNGPRIGRIYGSAFATGVSAEDTADRFRMQNAAMFGVTPDELIAMGPAKNSSYIQPVMLDPVTGEYKFTMVYYRQVKDGYPVYRSQIGLLMRNEADYPLVLASADLKDLRNFGFEQSLAASPFDPGAHIVGFGNFSEPETVVWAGVNDMNVEPRLAVTFIGDNGRNDDQFEKFRFVCDLETGDVLYKETMIHFTDVTGSVDAMATPGAKANICTDEILFAYPWARVEIVGGSSVYADGNGDFTIPNAGSSAVSVRSYVDGLYFTIDNRAGAEETLTATVTPGVPYTFTHNAANTDDLVLAQTNIYTSGNVCRDWLLSWNPTFPGVSTETGVLTVVNRTDFYCPCNAWSDGSDGSINFCQPGSDGGITCPNTAWQSVLNHEYGHHIIDFTSSGQGAYGEGMGDCIAMLPVDDPNLGYGFASNCNAGLRTADNTCQYLSGSACSTCGSEIHDCGQLLSGIVWSIRNELTVTEPADYLDIISNIVVNSILLHTGTSIDAQIAIDFLTLDDDDANIGNGTPHYAEICAGFGDHGLSCPAIDEGMSVSPGTDYEMEGASGGPFTPASKLYTVENLGPGSFDYSVTCPASWITITNGSGSLPNVNDEAVVTIAPNANAALLADGVYSSTISFTNTTNGQGNTSVDVRLTVGIPVVVYEWTFDTNPGWTIAGQWAFGQPTGGGSSNGDPTSGYTGNNVYGYNLTGDYTDNLSATYLRSEAFDCTGLADVTLKFRRWLGVESNSNYDEATIEASNNGSSWTVIWRATDGGVDISDSSWQLVEYSLAAVADDQATVYVRWGMGPTDGGLTFPGWNIDDVQIVAIGGEVPALNVSLPDGPPTNLEPGVATQFNVQIINGDEDYVPGSGTLYYRYSGGTYQTAALTSLGGNLYQATLPPAMCASTPEFYVSAQGDGGATIYNPASAPIVVYSATVGTYSYAIDDNFETDLGWTATNLGASSGDWQRGVPVNDPSWDYDPTSDADGSGQCWLTQNAIGNTDIDGGAVRLTSPIIDMTGGDVTISYYYFLRLTNTDGTDKLLVEINNNGGSGSWIQIASHTTDGGLSWRYNEITQAQLDSAGVTLTANMQLRFTANDDGTASINESGLDAFKVLVTGCEDVILTGACCLSDETCVADQLQADCDTAGGSFLGVGSACSAGACPCIGLMGDVNNDGIVNGRDVQGFVDDLLGTYNPCSDFDDDDAMTSGDIAGMLQALGV